MKHNEKCNFPDLQHLADHLLAVVVFSQDRSQLSPESKTMLLASSIAAVAIHTRISHTAKEIRYSSTPDLAQG